MQKQMATMKPDWSAWWRSWPFRRLFPERRRPQALVPRQWRSWPPASILGDRAAHGRSGLFRRRRSFNASRTVCARGDRPSPCDGAWSLLIGNRFWTALWRSPRRGGRSGGGAAPALKHDGMVEPIAALQNPGIGPWPLLRHRGSDLVEGAGDLPPSTEMEEMRTTAMMRRSGHTRWPWRRTHRR